jgi:serine/threonine protein kinase
VTPARWQQITDLFHAALDLDPAGREAFLRNATAGDSDLLREVETLLRSHGRAAGFLDEPAWGVAADLILNPPGESLTGRHLGPYHVGREIGRGGMGIVYAAEDQRLGRIVALKALISEFARDPVRRERLTREARAAAALSHPAIATVFALEEIEGKLYIVSEFVQGRTLREELAGGALPPQRLLLTLLDVAAALAAAHERGIVHRDLKPENVIRRLDGQVKVLDFGLASSTGSPRPSSAARLTDAGVPIGTPGYMAPEQFGGGEVAASADVFAFGILAWELATGEHPFGTDPASSLVRMTELMAERSSARPLPLPGLERIIGRCLRPVPAERYASGAPLLADLQRLAHGTSERPDAGRLWWWQFHQLTVAGLNSSMAIALWAIRHWLVRPYGSAMFLVTLMLATVSVTLRLNLWFTSRVHPDTLTEHRARLSRALTGADGLFAVALLTSAALISGEHDEMSALLVTVGVATFASLVLIEPATTNQAGLEPRKPDDTGTRPV